MSITSGKTISRAALSAATDSTVTNPAAGTTHTVTSLIIHERGGASAVIELFLSDDATSAAGERIERLSLGANETGEFRPVSVAGGQYLIVQSDVANVNYHGSYTYRDGADI